MKLFNLTHTQTDYLLTYPEEHSYSAEDEAEMLRRKTDSVDEIELLAFVDGAIVGSAGIGCVALEEKTRHRAGARPDAAGVIKRLIRNGGTEHENSCIERQSQGRNRT